MGFERHATRYLIRANANGADFSRTLMLGRQGMHLSAEDLGRLLPSLSPEHLTSLLKSGYAEEFLKQLGATRVESMDASAYEGASIVHDLNEKISPSLHGKYSMVIDAGTQEHVLDFPTSLANAINLLEPGGHLIMITPANNFFGHGFYQFSPELFDSVFGPHNGMELVDMVACEDFESEERWFKVRRPSEMGARVMLKSHFCVLLLVTARRIGSEPVTKIRAMQSDYQVAWDDKQKAASIHDQGGQEGKQSILLSLAKKFLRSTFYRNSLAQDPECYQEIFSDRE